MTMMRPLPSCAALLLVAACSVPFLDDDAPAPADTAAAPHEGDPRPQPRDTDEADAEDETELAALAAPGRGGELGETIASLGSPAESGAWLRTPMVSSPQSGRVVDEESGRELDVELRPSGGVPGTGSRLSLEGYQALGINPTELPRLRVFMR